MWFCVSCGLKGLIFFLKRTLRSDFSFPVSLVKLTMNNIGNSFILSTLLADITMRLPL